MKDADIKNVEDLIEERGKQHGSIHLNCRVTKDILSALKDGWIDAEKGNMPFVVEECLHMIAHKLSRFAVGDHYHRDHLDDVMGYAMLLGDELERVQ